MSKTTEGRRRTFLLKESHWRPRWRCLFLTSILLAINALGWLFMLYIAGLSGEILLFVAVMGAFTTGLCGAPLIIFLSLGWFTRYSEFQNSLKGGALVAYLQRFWSPSLIHSLEDEKLLKPDDPDWRTCADKNPVLCERLFARIYHEQYGLVPFVVPFTILLSMAYAGAALYASNYLKPACLHSLQLVCIYPDMDSPLLLSSLAGAFMFVVSDSVLGIRRKSLNISDVYWYALRLFLAIPLALVIASAGPKGTHLALAFALGTLPIDPLMKVIRRLGFPQLTAEDRDGGSSDKLLVLEGVTLPVVATLESEGINSIEQVAAADPVLLSIRTGFPFRFTLRLGSQAIVRRHLGQNASQLIDVGLADVVPIYLLVRALDPPTEPSASGPFPLIEAPDVIVQTAAKRLFPNDEDISRQAVTKMKFRQIAAEEYTVMLARITPPDTGL